MPRRTYRVGDIINYHTFTGQVRTVRVTKRKIVKGKPGFSGVIVDGPEKGYKAWGYDSQIETAAKKRRR